MIAGVDEAGRGPLAGPVTAAAVILNPAQPIEGLADSKKISERRREYLFACIQERALAWTVAEASPQEIDELNILQATLLAMQRAVEALAMTPTAVWVDGTHAPRVLYPVTTVIRGDATVAAISAASIIAKVTRDRQMVALDAEYPGYGFAIHKGYPTKTHIAALMQLGPAAIHRYSFAPVRNAKPLA